MVSLTQDWAALPRGYFSDWFIAHGKRHTCGNHLRWKPAPYASCKIPPSEAEEKSSFFPSPSHFLQLLWSHRIWETVTLPGLPLSPSGNQNERLGLPPPLSSATFSEVHHPWDDSSRGKSPSSRGKRKTRMWVLPEASSWPHLRATTSWAERPSADSQGGQ